VPAGFWDKGLEVCEVIEDEYRASARGVVGLGFLEPRACEEELVLAVALLDLMSKYVAIMRGNRDWNAFNSIADFHCDSIYTLHGHPRIKFDDLVLNFLVLLKQSLVVILGRRKYEIRLHILSIFMDPSNLCRMLGQTWELREQ
jgi:hypothetical protein